MDIDGGDLTVEDFYTFPQADPDKKDKSNALKYRKTLTIYNQCTSVGAWIDSYVPQKDSEKKPVCGGISAQQIRTRSGDTWLTPAGTCTGRRGSVAVQTIS